VLQTFIDDVGLVVGSSDDQHEITKRVAQRLSARGPTQAQGKAPA
jgi:hypothetical protein